ncbi:DnaJ (Hsp40), sub B, member 12 [Rhizopus stolonifer]|uniref:DnaJ (Hsp40), sub B, member 12 n=1 Tax=Rhizopus stolonifer TaxID=4846 RepID=A0A367KXX1_RHIST|nr:DnaJ (Hsp40), sub B, member 12 [Rhizopus stolonifer]
MESNKDEALRCLAIAKNSFEAGDLSKAKRLAEKSKRLYPTAQVEQFLLITKKTKDPIQDRPHQKTSSSNLKQPKESKLAERKYSTDQISAVKAVLSCSGDYYKALSVERTATDKDIKKAYRTKALLFHPDKNNAPGADEAFKLIAKAYDVLSNSNERAIYDSSNCTENRNMRTSSSFYQPSHAYNRRYRQEVSPEDLFNMFFNGGGMPSSFGTSFHTNQSRHHSARHQKYQRQQQYTRQSQKQNQKKNQYAKQQEEGLAKYFPLFIILIILVFSSLFSTQDEPLYTFQPAASNTYKRTTSRNYVDYYVNPNTFIGKVGNSRYRLKRAEKQIEVDWVGELRKNCNREQKQRGYRSSKRPPSCDAYDRLSRRV